MSHDPRVAEGLRLAFQHFDADDRRYFKENFWALETFLTKQFDEISRLTAELADEKAVNEHQRSELQDRVKKQRATEAELSSTQQQLGECSGGYETLEREVASLRAELEKARKDAGRYRWLREATALAKINAIKNPEWPMPMMVVRPPLAMDAAIDAAMTKEKS